MFNENKCKHIFMCREPRGFGFVKFRNPEDAAEAKYQLNHTVIGGREITIVFAEENRKTPQEMRTTSRVRYYKKIFYHAGQSFTVSILTQILLFFSSRHGGSHQRRSPPRSPRRRYHCQFLSAIIFRCHLI